MAGHSSSPLTLHGLILVLVAFGLLGLSTELALLEHYEDVTMIIPLAAIAVALGAVVFVAWKPGRVSVRVMRVAMALFAVVGVVGVMLHYQGGLEFQVDMDPTASTMQLFWKVMRMKAPPMLAPGMMVQLGLLGLLATWRHPAVASNVPVVSSKGASL